MRWFWRGMPLVLAVLSGSACGVTDADEPLPVGSITVAPSTMEVAAGATGALDAEVRDEAGNVLRNRRIVWASAKPTIATVSENGVVTGVAAGLVDIAATSEGRSATARVTVVAPAAKVSSVRIVPDKVTLFVAATASLTATGFDSKGAPVPGRQVVWTTNNAPVAAVSQTGRVTGIIPGTAVITAVIDGAVGTSAITVTMVPVARVMVSPADLTIDAGKSATLTARTLDASGNTLTGRAIVWSSSDTRFVTVDQAGVIRGIRRGSAVVSAASEGKLGTASVRVN
jgi:uncharacterized protein YjdB